METNNQYWVITNGVNNSNLSQVLARGTHDSPQPNNNVSTRTNLDGSKTIVQSLWSDSDLVFLQSNAWALYIGKNIEGVADQSVFDYLREHASEWTASE